jgi:type I restriction enzyme R subunit
MAISNFDFLREKWPILSQLGELAESLHISTVQGMVKRILYSGDKEDKPAVDWYDCIIVDEAHRGYLLDREMSEDEQLFRDQTDYISKYRSVLEFFDAVKIGLTATPAQQTVEIFGKPVYTYSYREAVIDGWLVDHEPPHKLITYLSEEGIKFKKDEVVPVYNPETGEITNSEELPDEVLFEDI